MVNPKLKGGHCHNNDVADIDHTHDFCQIQTGTYNGNGAGNGANWDTVQEISLNFTPKHIIIHAPVIDTVYFEWHPDMPTNYSWQGHGGGGGLVAFRLRGITDAFEVNDAGADNHPNKNGKLYSFTAWG